MTLRDTWHTWAQRLRRDTLTLWCACRHPRTPWWLKLCAMVVVAYALSPIDVIPDFIPVLGLLDEMLLLPAMVWLLVRAMPPEVMAQCRAQAQAHVAAGAARPRSWWGAVLVLGIWLAALAAAVWWWRR